MLPKLFNGSLQCKFIRTFFFTEKLESETTAKQTNLETLRREKVELENTLEQEQEALVNKLWKRMDQLETGIFFQIPKL